MTDLNNSGPPPSALPKGPQERNFGSNISAVSVIAALFAAVAASAAAIFAYQQVETAKDSEWRSLRAYISVRPPKISFEIGKPVATNAEILVAGQTPAYNVNTVFYLAGGGQIAPTFEFLATSNLVKKKNLHKFSIFSSEHTPLNIESWKLETSDVAPYQKGNFARIYSAGIVQYEDVFGYHHTVKYCYSFFGDALGLKSLSEEKSTPYYPPEECGGNDNTSDDNQTCTIK